MLALREGAGMTTALQFEEAFVFVVRGGSFDGRRYIVDDTDQFAEAIGSVVEAHCFECEDSGGVVGELIFCGREMP